VSIDDQLNSNNLKWDKCDNRVLVSGALQGHESKEVKGMPTIKIVTLTGKIDIIARDWIDTLRLMTRENNLSID